jgi:dihydrofolate reductase
MHVTLHMATSIDGFIAGVNGDTSWVSAQDEQLFLSRCRAAGCMAVGRRTFQQYHDIIYPVADTDNIVVTRTTAADADRVSYVASPRDAVAKAQSLGRSQMLLSGGGKVSALFLNEGLIDEIFLSVHPVVIGQGIRLFDGARFVDSFVLKGVSELGGGVAQLHYHVRCP